ncbi:hypothetical protein [Granulicella arctica]|uniref:hypothetical protein n=1 Tax=Granulicella arctica TaxID=940613 RepID=UPI0021E0C9A8|nr:hypothetical protein [Granulicella arctica]
MQSQKVKRRNHHPHFSAVAACWILGLILLMSSPSLAAQDTPIISGGAGFFASRNLGTMSFQPVLAPVVAFPLGKHFLAESRFDFREFYTPENGATGPYKGTFFKATQALQLDYVVNRHVTLVAGRFLTPFGTYNERLSAIWIQRFQDAPLIFSAGDPLGSGNGAMLRGVIFSKPAVQMNYIGYFEASSSISQFQSVRSVGDRIDIYFPRKRLEIGSSFSRVLTGTPVNAYGTHVWWTPARSPLQVRSEYVHAAHAQGY